MRRALFAVPALTLAALALFSPRTEARVAEQARKPSLTAQSYAIVDIADGSILHGRLPYKRLPPASTVKVMTVLVAMKFLPPDFPVVVGRNAANAAPSKAGLTLGERYKASDLVKACLVASSNDAAVALAEAVSGREREFAQLMDQRAKEIGMTDTHFVNATGLTDKRRAQYTTAYDLTKLMREAVKDRRVDEMMGLIDTTIRGSDGKVIALHAHNKMLWKTPKFVKGKTGWTHASRHTFVGTDYAPHKSIAFALLSSKKPWTDIERLASFGIVLARRR
jgi:D-alanyl-D-alanine carboxypeptidase (penicillin-binding protein 5/6)